MTLSRFQLKLLKINFDNDHDFDEALDEIEIFDAALNDEQEGEAKFIWDAWHVASLPAILN